MMKITRTQRKMRKIIKFAAKLFFNLNNSNKLNGFLLLFGVFGVRQAIWEDIDIFCACSCIYLFFIILLIYNELI